VIRPETTGNEAVTWGEFVEAGYLNEYRLRGVSLQRLRPVVQRLRERLGVPYPLAHAKPYLEGKELVLEVQEETGLPPGLHMVVVRNGQLTLAPCAEAYREKIEFEPDTADGAAVRLFPESPHRRVVIDPLRAFGAPSIRGIRTENLYDLFAAGDSVASIARAYALDVEDVEDAIRYESVRTGSGQETAA
jgi:uncharacterized protein (DUF433 family)